MQSLDLDGVSLGTTLLLGATLGFKHSLETDHLLAVSTLVSRERNVARSMLMGAVWGLGHTFTLLLIGLLIVVLRIQIPQHIATSFEFAVALMLIALGARTIWQWRSGTGHFCRHTHDDAVTHTHFHAFGEHACEHEQHQPDGGRRASFLVGAVHGLAGSSALMLLVLAAIPNPVWALLYVVLFGLGSVGGMCLVTAIVSWSLQRLGERFMRVGQALQGAVGAASLGFGCYLAWQISREIL